mmetsp:Transcript_57732/g.122816  ORF Transcript_57732/g.122816 Transcript_57732/m.122816 type:complete len:137 (+) Transcript_57732:135-545(+)
MRTNDWMAEAISKKVHISCTMIDESRCGSNINSNGEQIHTTKSDEKPTSNDTKLVIEKSRPRKKLLDHILRLDRDLSPQLREDRLEELNLGVFQPGLDNSIMTCSLLFKSEGSSKVRRKLRTRCACKRKCCCTDAK